jgi:hypothetical protein
MGVPGFNVPLLIDMAMRGWKRGIGYTIHPLMSECPNGPIMPWEISKKRMSADTLSMK